MACTDIPTQVGLLFLLYTFMISVEVLGLLDKTLSTEQSKTSRS